MSYKKVRMNATYIYDPVPIDRFDGKTGLVKGDVVTVTKGHLGCPGMGVMGHCYVAKDKKFVGMVCVNSLCSKEEYAENEKYRKEMEEEKYHV